jgi:hypothetical protein
MEIGESLASPGNGIAEIRMTTGRWQFVKSIFDGAVECDPAARAEFLREHCGSDEELRKEVESMLASRGGADSLPEEPVRAEAAITAAAKASPVDAQLANRGTTLVHAV